MGRWPSVFKPPGLLVDDLDVQALFVFGIVLMTSSCSMASAELVDDPGTNIAIRWVGKLGVNEHFSDPSPAVLELRSPDGSVEVVNPPQRPWTPFSVETIGAVELCWWFNEVSWEEGNFGVYPDCEEVEVVDGAFIEIGRTGAGTYLCVLDNPNNELETACDVS